MEAKPPEKPNSIDQANANPSSPPPPTGAESSARELSSIAQQEANIPLWKDFGYFLLHNKKWWLLPIIVILILLGLFTALSSTAIAPFIYTVF